jgi:peptide/nickel transport system permease protein
MAASTSSRAWQRLKRNKLAWVTGAFIAFLLYLVFFGRYLLVDGDDNILSPFLLAPPSEDFWIGTDELGRSVLTQIVYGVRTSIAIGLLAALSATLLGVTVGALSGFIGGAFDVVVMRIAEIFQVMPTFILAAVMVAMSGPGTANVIFVIAILAWPQTARLMRGEVLRVKSLDFVDAVRCLGKHEQRILWSEVVPNAFPPVMAVATLTIGTAILLEASLGFFGLTSPDIPSWGRMLSTGQKYFYQAPWLSICPGIAILLTVLAFNLMGDCISNAFRPRSSGRGR